jgi:hypothetical protein
MPVSQLWFFVGWLVVALIGGAVLYNIWPWLCVTLGLPPKADSGR